MISHLSLATFATALLAMPSLVLGVDDTRNPELVAQLKAAATNRDRRALLSKDSDWLYDFTEQPYYGFAPGGVINANAATFPATVGNGMTMALLNLGPCSMLPMHFHPRATNYVVAMFGKTQTYMISENGAGVVTEVLTPGKMTIFPQASLHMMMNIDCENAQLVSALNSEDPGTLNFGYAMQSLPEDLFNAAMGYQDISTNETRSTIWPVGTGSNYGPEECLTRCAALNTTAPTCGPPSPSGSGYGDASSTSGYNYSPNDF